MGILLYKLVFGTYPFTDTSFKETKQKIIKAQLKFPDNIEASSMLKDFLKKVLIKNPAKRPLVFQM